MHKILLSALLLEREYLGENENELKINNKKFFYTQQVNIACELITDPSLLFLDEPTSGLDSFTALNMMETLLALAANGRTIVCNENIQRKFI
jgi:ABC-type Na+ transport system ATPase subunit NatA